VIYRHAVLFSYVWRHGVQCRGVGGRPGGPCPGLVLVMASWLALCLNRGGFEGEGVVVGRGVFRRARGSH
jgi:hypothetical protein